MRGLKIITVLLILTFLCGCGNASKKNSQRHDIDQQETVTITLTHCWSQQEIIDQIADKYNSTHDSIHVEVEYIPVEQYVTTLKNRSAAGNLSEIYMGWPGSSMEWFYKNGLTFDLTDEEWVKRLDADTEADVTYENTIRMLPLNKTFICIGYNKEIFDRYECEIPQNYDEFLDICETLKINGILPMAIGSRDASGYIYPSWMMAVSEIYAYDPDYNQKLYSGTELMGERWETILKRQYEWVQKGYVDENHLAIDRMSDSLDLFVNGEAGMFILGSWEIDSILERMKSAESMLNMGFFPMPSSQDAGTLLLASGEGLCVNAVSIKREQALEVLRYFTEKEPNQMFQTAMNSFTTFHDLGLEYSEILDEINVYVEGKDTWGYPDAPWPRIIGDKYSELFPKYLADKITADEFMREMEKLWKESIF